MFTLKKASAWPFFCVPLLSGVLLMGVSGRVSCAEYNSAAENAIPQLGRPTDGYDRLFQLATPRQECSTENIDEQLHEISNGTATDNVTQQKITVAQIEQCLISTEKAQNLWQRKKLLFVDVRPAQEYRAAHISGALNISEHAIKTKTFLKKKFIVLVNNGHSINKQVLSCVNLKAAGFARVGVLQGGILSWSLHAPLQGDIKIAQIDQLTAMEFNQAQQENDWVIVDVSKHKTDISGLFPGKKVLKNNKSIQTYLAKRTNQYSSILVVGAEEGNTLELSDLVQKNTAQSVYFLNVSIHDYRDYLAKHNVMLSKLATPKRVKRCGG